MTIGGLIRTFGEAGTGANANADFGFLPDPQARLRQPPKTRTVHSIIGSGKDSPMQVQLI